MKKQLFIYKSFYVLSSIFTFIIGLIFYDSTTGLDFGFYITSVNFFNGVSSNIYDPQGLLYFYIIAELTQLISSIIDLTLERILLNNVIQTFNFILFIVGLQGIKTFLISKGFKLNNIYIILATLCFFPPSLYLRFTMKPEILAFAIFPWLITSLEFYFENRKFYILIFSTSLFALSTTSKASIFGMILFCLLFLFYDQLINFKKNIVVVLSLIMSSLFIIIENYFTGKLWLFSKSLSPNNFSGSLGFDAWNHRASLNFFLNIDYKNLIENPYNSYHFDSFVGITLLDTLSDYFGFFWNHKEITNLIAFNRIEFTENFLIQKYLPMYLSIIFTFSFYIILLLLICFKVKNWKYFSFPIFGLLILTLNSIGIPSNNFNPQTGDTFKVHYYAFLICFTFAILLITILQNFKFSKALIPFLIAAFLITIGFPKEMTLDNQLLIEEKYNLTINCLLPDIQIEVCKQASDKYQLANFDIQSINNLMKDRNILILNKFVIFSLFLSFISFKKRFNIENY